jgi:hypothetical protein
MIQSNFIMHGPLFLKQTISHPSLDAGTSSLALRYYRFRLLSFCLILFNLFSPSLSSLPFLLLYYFLSFPAFSRFTSCPNFDSSIRWISSLQSIVTNRTLPSELFRFTGRYFRTLRFSIFLSRLESFLPSSASHFLLIS